jgi:hypothetical protein
MRPISKDLDYEVDKEMWDKSFDFTDATHIKPGIINRYIIGMLECYRTIYSKYTGENLWQLFHEDFEDFTFDIFKLGYRVALRNFRNYLIS